MNRDDDNTQTHIVLTKDTMVSHYRIVSKIGAGGMGEVYLADDTELDRKVALKFMSWHLCQDEDCRARFKREARAAAGLSNPNIVTVHEVSEYQGRPFIVMEYVRGQSVKDLMSSGNLPLNWIADLGLQVCEGLRRAHQSGVTHRDIKPSNIIIDHEGRARLVDFGLATIEGTEKLTKTGSTTGTVGYMSPEQVRGDDVDSRSDIFSLGVVLYEMITGRLPFEGDREAAVVYSIVHNTPEPLAGQRAEAPEAWQDLIDKALRKDPEARYQTVDDLAADLKRLSGETAAGVGSGHDLKRRGRRKAWLAVAGSLAVVAAGVVLAAFIFPDAMDSFWRRITFSSDSRTSLFQAAQKPFIVIVAPFFGRTDDAIEEGRVMQALIEREILEELGGEDDARVLGREITVVPASHEEAQTLGEEYDASLVLWGEVLTLRGEVEIQPNMTVIKSDGRSADDATATALEANLAEPNQLALRKAKASEVRDMALLVAARFYRSRGSEKAQAILDKLSSPSAESLCFRGDLLSDAGQKRRAGELYRQAYSLDSVSAYPAYKLGGFYESQKKYDSALSIMERALTLSPDDELLLHRISFAYSAAGNKEGAVAFLQEMIARNPRSAPRHTDLGWAFLRQHRVDAAIAEHKQAIRLDPECGDAYYGLGWVYEFSDSLDLAVEYYKGAIRVGTKWFGRFAPHFTLGRVYFKQGEYERAISAQFDAITVNPWFVSSYYYLAQAYVELDRTEDAVARFQEAIDILPQNSDLRMQFAQFYLEQDDTAMAVATVQETIAAKPGDAQLHVRGGRLYNSIGDTARAVAEYREALRHDPENGDAYYWLGWFYEFADSLDQAVEHYQAATRVATSSVGGFAPHFTLGRVYGEQGKLDQSISEYENAIALNPQYTRAYSILGSIYMRHNRVDEAIAVYQQAVADNPANAQLHTDFARLYNSLDSTDKALSEHREVLRLDPENGDAHYRLGWFYEFADSLDQAVEHYRAAIRVGTSELRTFAPHFTLGRVYNKQGKPEQAISEYQKTIALNPQGVPAYTSLGSIYMTLGRDDEAIALYQKAVAEFREAVRLDPQNGDVYCQLAFFYRDLDSLDLALSTFEAAAQLETSRWSKSGIYWNMATIKASQGRYEEAVASARQALDNQEPSAIGHSNLGSFYTSAGQYENALAEYQKAIRLDPDDIYHHLFYYLALHQTGRAAEGETYATGYSATLEDSLWPAAIVHFFVGDLDEDGLLTAMEHEDPNADAKMREGEVYYYLGMAHLLNAGSGMQLSRPDTAAALAYFERCLAVDDQRITEYRLAEAELRRLRNREL